MDFEEIKNMATNGASYINPSPSKSKKNPSPKILSTLDPKKIAELATSFADREINEGLTSGKVLTNQADKADQLRHYGVTPNASIVDVDKVLAESQSNLRKLGSAVSQAVVSEIGLGTVRGAADLFDFIGNAVTGNLANNDYTNPVSEKIQEWQDYFNTEVAPIYADPNLDITNGGLTDFGWWASNMPSIMSSVTLLLPSMAATKGLQWLAKASAASKLGTATRNGIKALVGIDRALSKEGRTLNKFQQGVKTLVDAPINGLGARTGQFVETGLNAALSRTMENYQEAQGVYSDVFNTATSTLNKMTPQEFTEFVNKNQDIYDEAGGDNASKEDIARVIAQKSANQDFLTNYVNIGSDILQLYGLRNMWKGLKNGVSSSTLTSAARNARRTLGKTPEEIAEMEAKQSFLKKAGQKIIDKALDEKTVIAGELSEGLEEAVNYIAQMEGTHLGNVYLGLESDSAFDDRLQKYMRSGGLWDSAFWGVMGGVVFHHLGSGFGRISQTLKDKADSKTDERTGEGKPKSIFSLSETSEIKARKANIESWNNSIENYWNQMSQIKDGNNPFSDSDEDKTFNNDLDKEAAAQQAYDELLTDMTLNAAHNGNLNMLRSYMASNDVRKAMVDKGVTDEANSKADQQKALDKMDEVTASYEAELKKLVNLSEAVRVTKHTDDILPIEFLQSIASNNVINKQYNDKINAQIDELDKQIGTAFDNEDIKNILGQDYTPEQYQIAASTALLTNELRTLQAERSRLLSDKKKMNNISTKVAVDNINKLMNKYQDMIDTNTLRYSLYEALQGAYNDKGKVQSFVNQASTTLANLLSGTSNSGVLLNDENIISGLKKFAEKFSVSPRIAEFENPTDIVNQVREHGSYLRKINRKLQATDKVGVNGTDGTLSALLVNKTALELRRAYNESKMVNNADELATEISFMNNTMNEGRKKAIDSAYETITKLSDKYGNDKFAAKIGDAIGAYYQRSKDDINSILDFMSEDDKSALNDALDVLNLTKGKNYRLGEQIQRFLSLRQDIFDSQEREESHNVNNPDDSNNGAEPESTTTPPSTQTTSNPASQVTQPQQPINQPASTPQSPTVQGNTPTGNSQSQSVQPMARNEQAQPATQPQVVDRAELTANFMGKLRTSGKEIKAGNLTAEDFIKSLQNEGIALGASQEDIDGAISSVKAVMNNLLGTAFASSVGEVMLASAVEEYKPSLSFGNEYKDAANNMLKNYASEVKLRQHNGKYYGNLEDLLRYINEHSPSKNTADFIYNSLKNYLKTEEGKKQFVMLDADSVDDAEFMTNVHKTAGERRAEAIKAGTLKRVNIRGLSEVVPPDRINASRDELDKIKEGDKLTVKKANKLATNTDVLLVQHNGITVGWMGIPTFDVSTGRYIQVNDCIKYTVGRSAEYDGAVKDWILSIADPKDEDSRKLNDLLYKIAFDKKYDGSFVEKFKNNPRVQEAVNNDFIVINEDKGFTYAKALDGMVKLWRYNPNVSSFNPIPESIKLFFDNLRTSYQTSLALINNNQELTVSKISKGELLRLAPHGTPGEAFRFAQPASIAISSKTDARIALARNLSQIEVSGKQTNDNLGFRMNQTLIAIDNGNGTIDYTNAYPVNWGVTNYEKDGKLVDMPHSKVLADLTNAIEGQIIDRLTNLQKGDSLSNWNEFRSFLDTLLDYNNNSTLFKTSGVFHRNNGLTYINAGTKAVALYACDTKRTGAPTQLVFMEHGKKVSSYSLLDNGAEAGKALVQFLRENATVNFAHELLSSDNNTSIPLKGFVSRNADGKLVINIPEYNGKNGFNHVEESYNDFMIKNDLLRVDLAQVDGSNYSRFSSNMKANSVLEFTVGDEVKQEEEKPLETPRKGHVNTNTTDQVKSIIESDSKTKGLDIAKAILSEEAVNLLNNAGKLASILPENVIFANDRIEKFRASEKNNNINAMYEKGDIVVGDDFFKETSGRQVRILIHEGLHKRLHDYGPSQHRKFLNNMTEIYNDFSKAIDEDLKDIADGNIKAVRERRNFEDTLTDEAITDWLKYIDSFKFKEYLDRGELNRAKEEFIVESLTNVEFIDYLNKVKVDDVGDKSRHRTAWQMIMDFINKLFRLDIAEGSLREKEYNAFAKALSIDKNADTNVQTETEPTIEKNQDEQVEGKVVEDETLTPGADKDISNGVDLDDVYDDDDDVNLSSRSEYPSLYSTIESLPMEQHSQFATLLASGDISITCK